MTDPPLTRSATEPSASQLDPVLHLRRDHTLLDMLGEGFQEVASQMERGERVDPERIREGVKLHHDFLLGIHEPKERLVAEALERLPDAPRREMLAECRRDREEAARWEENVDRALRGGDGGQSGDGARTVAGLLRREADRVRDHHHREEETVFRDLDRVLPRDVQRGLVDRMLEFRVKSASVEERLAAWTSRTHPASD
jgi:hemerythrin-like domain-containing protein